MSRARLWLVRAVVGAADPEEVFLGDVGVDLGGLRVGVTEEFLDVPYVGAVLQEVGGEAVAEGMDADLLRDADLIFSSGKDFLYGACAEVAPVLPFEEPGLGFVELEVGLEDALGSGGQYGIAVFPAFSAPDEDDAPCRVYVG